MTKSDTTTDTSSGSYSFTETHDWFSRHIPSWEKLFPRVTSCPPRALEIGSWEGRSAVYTLNNLCAKGGSIVCIDYFDALTTEHGRAHHDKLVHNLRVTGKPHRVMVDCSTPALMQLLEETALAADDESERGYDWIYVDGSHEAANTFLDAELAWRMARKGAIMVFDDYRWKRKDSDSPHHPRRGIDAFMMLRKGEYEILVGAEDEDYQMVLRKTSDMDIGFMFKGQPGKAVIVD